MLKKQAKLSPDGEKKQNCHLTLKKKPNCHLTLVKLSPDVGKIVA